MTFEERLEQMREDLKWLASECLTSDEMDCARDSILATVAIDRLRNTLADAGLEESDWDRPGPPTLAPRRPEAAGEEEWAWCPVHLRYENAQEDAACDAELRALEETQKASEGSS